jgi:hypothetical protein
MVGFEKDRLMGRCFQIMRFCHGAAQLDKKIHTACTRLHVLTFTVGAHAQNCLRRPSFLKNIEPGGF